MELPSEMIERGAQALANDVWHPPQRLGNLARYEADKFRRQSRLVLEAALQQTAEEIADVLVATGMG
jgi:hypothetical protein